ncbi:MAG: DUF3179 domain-containing protein [Desulfovibrio sp.]|nr:DUF3179 domain-containing protein [Desulfovibrio sp.]
MRTLLLTLLLSLALILPAYAKPKTITQLSAINDYLVNTSIKHGAIPSIYNPTYIPVRDADLIMDRNDVVFIVNLPNGIAIYPQKIMVWHQIVNETINDIAYAITYCPITGTLAAYNATIPGVGNLLFDIEGELYDGNSVLIDRNTGSLWLQELGMAFNGPLLGRGMPTLEVYWTHWEAAQRVFPTAKVLSPPKSRKAYGRDPYGSYVHKDSYYYNETVIYHMQRRDSRFPKKTPMLCLELPDTLVGIDINYVKEKGAVNFFAGNLALVAMHDPKLDVVRVFDRNIWTDPFLFVRKNGVIRDLQTLSVWDPIAGTATEGNMKGAKMKQYFGIYSMWMAWYSINPETMVIPGPGEVSEKYLSMEPIGEAKDPITRK